MNNALVAFQEAMRASGVFLAADTHITPDGQLHRARATDDKAGALSIWYNFHPDAPASGAAGNWRTGAKLTWCGKRLQALSHAERETLRLRIEENKHRAQEAQEARHRDAAARALQIWDKSEPASPDHAYLLKKQIAPGVSRQSGDALVLPVQDFAGQLWGLQFIQPDGSKKFLSGMKKTGGFIRTDGMPDPAKRLLICEGWATGQTLAALSPGACVLAACDAGNLQAVACEARRRFPHIDLVVAADSDPVGMEKAKAAAVASRAKWIWPRFPKDAPAGLSDFNDWRCWRKSQGVSHAE